MSLYNSSHTFAVHSLYDKISEQLRIELEIEYYQGMGRSALLEQDREYYREAIKALERELATIGPINNVTKCECGAEAAGFDTHAHYCPKYKR